MIARPEAVSADAAPDRDRIIADLAAALHLDDFRESALEESLDELLEIASRVYGVSAQG